MNIPQDIKWVPSIAFDERAPYRVDRLIIHTTEGSYSSSLGWLTRPNGNNSAHYIISEDGNQAAQMVDLANNAWHCGNLEWNKRSVGIENSGFQGRGNFSDGLYRASAKIAAFVCNKFNIIPVHGKTIFAHNDVPQDPNDWHTDPGPFWDWVKYINYINQELNKMTIPAGLVNRIGVGMLAELQKQNLTPASEEIYLISGRLSELYTKEGPVLKAVRDIDLNVGTLLNTWTVRTYPNR